MNKNFEGHFIKLKMPSITKKLNILNFRFQLKYKFEEKMMKPDLATYAFFKLRNEWPKYMLFVSFLNCFTQILFAYFFKLFYFKLFWTSVNIIAFSIVFFQFENQLENFYLKKIVSVYCFLAFIVKFTIMIFWFFFSSSLEYRGRKRQQFAWI